MPDLSFLREFVIILASAVAAVLLLRHLRIPTIAGFIAAGVLVGPNALGLVSNINHVELLAELGVVLLLFGIGLELSLERIRAVWRLVAIGGAVQVGISILVVTAISMLFGMNIRSAVLVGCIVAISSTAIVLRGLSKRGEIEAPHGQLALGILVFQDLCVVPMILIIPLLADTQQSIMDAALSLMISVAVLIGVILVAKVIVPRLLDVVAATRERGVFVLTVFLIGLGIAWAVSLAGISIALGAFLAGLIVVSGKHKPQVLSDIVPLREVLATTFFVSLGMLLDLEMVMEHAIPILGLFVAIVLGKFVIITLTARFMKLSLRASVLTGAALCQVGEFSFVLLHAADGTGLLNPSLASSLTVAIILSMLITPFALSFGPRLASGIESVNLVHRLFGVRMAADVDEDGSLRNHVIIAGYGLTGQTVSRLLTERGISSIVVDLNITNVNDAMQQGQSACFGDITSVAILEHLGAEHARMLVVSINDHDATVRAIAACRRLAPKLPIVARSRFDADVEFLKASGATYVISAEAAAAAGVVNQIVEHFNSIQT